MIKCIICIIIYELDLIHFIHVVTFVIHKTVLASSYTTPSLNDITEGKDCDVE